MITMATKAIKTIWRKSMAWKGDDPVLTRWSFFEPRFSDQKKKGGKEGRGKQGERKGGRKRDRERKGEGLELRER